jgi:uncharacterized protein involved in exopolysaccharide biosynthesis
MLINKVSIEPLDFKTKSFKISYKDKSAVKTRDITNMMVRVFVEYDIGKKREGFENVISFLNVQIISLKKAIQLLKIPFLHLRAQFGYMDKNELQTMSAEMSSTNIIIRMLTQDINFYKVV